MASGHDLRHQAFVSLYPALQDDFQKIGDDGGTQQFHRNWKLHFGQQIVDDFVLRKPLTVFQHLGNSHHPHAEAKQTVNVFFLDKRTIRNFRQQQRMLLQKIQLIFGEFHACFVKISSHHFVDYAIKFALGHHTDSDRIQSFQCSTSPCHHTILRLIERSNTSPCPIPYSHTLTLIHSIRLSDAMQTSGL